MKKIILLIVIITPLLFACGETIEYSNEAVKYSVAEITSAQLLSQLAYDINNYSPDTNLVKEVVQNFDTTHDKILIFANFTCSCNTDYNGIYQIIKTLINSGVPERCYEIYSMRLASMKHPYTSVLQLDSLPSIFVLRDSTVMYSVKDSFDLDTSKTVTIEDYLLKGLKK